MTEGKSNLQTGNKEVYQRDKPHFTIGTIGHVDHGKTTLTAAITKVLSEETNTTFYKYSDIDSNNVERSRGITINASHIEYETWKRKYTHIDCPGHQDYIKNMIIGANQMDGVILVISMTDGPQEQTREHLILIQRIGIKSMVVYGNKLDAMLEKYMYNMIINEIKETINTYGYSKETPIICGSARFTLEDKGTAEMGSDSVLKLMKTVDNVMPTVKRSQSGTFLMNIESIYSISGRGTVVSGKVEKGVLKELDLVQVVTSKKTFDSVCMGIEMHRKLLQSAYPGDNVGILVKKVKKGEVSRGDVLCEPGTVTSRGDFRAQVYFLRPEEGGRNNFVFEGYSPQFYFKTLNITGKIINIIESENANSEKYMPFVEEFGAPSSSKGKFISPGDNSVIDVSLGRKKAPIDKGLSFVVREGTTTVGAGLIL